jgi:hypothetical protein
MSDLGLGMDETRDEKPELRLVGKQIALAGLSKPEVGQKFVLRAVVKIDEVYSTAPPDGSKNYEPEPYVCLELERLELVPDPVQTAEAQIKNLYPLMAKQMNQEKTY